MRDAYNRKINYLRISVTDLCNLRCQYCMPEGGINKGDHKQQLRFEEYELIVKAFTQLGITKVRLTGGEPLVKKDFDQLAKTIGMNKTIDDFAVTTNGIVLLEHIESLQSAGVSRLNISLDTFDESKYEEITRGGKLSQVLKAIDEAIDKGFKVKLNAVLLKDVNHNQLDRFIQFAVEKDIDVRFIELMPIGEAIRLSKDWYLPLDYILETHPELKLVDNEDSSSPATYYQIPGGRGRIGLIRPVSCNFCHNCNRVRLTSQGKIKLCLHSEEEHDLKPILRDANKSQEDIVKGLKNYISKIIQEKPEKHLLKEGNFVNKNMVEIGG